MSIEGEPNSNMPNPKSEALALDYVEVPQYGEKLMQIRDGYARPVLDHIRALQEQNVDFSNWVKVAEFQRPAAESVGRENTSIFNSGLITAFLMSAAETGMPMDVSLSYYDGENVHTTTVATPQRMAEAPTPAEIGKITTQQHNPNLLIYQELDSQQGDSATDMRNYTIIFEAAVSD